MSEAESTIAARFRLTPGRVVVGLLAGECLLWVSNCLGWPLYHKGYAVLTAVVILALALAGMVFWLVASAFFRWRFQFSLRALLMLVVTVAVPLSWLAVEIKRATDQEWQVEGLGGSVGFDYEFDESGNALPGSMPPPGPEWLRGLLGDDFVSGVLRYSFFADIVWVDLDNTQVTDAQLERLKDLHQLRFLHLCNTQITDAGLEHLKGLSHLQWLILDDTQVTDRGLECLKGLSQLKDLSLGGTPVTDAGLEQLRELNQLRYLYLFGTKVTEAGGKRIKEALPNCEIYSP